MAILHVGVFIIGSLAILLTPGKKPGAKVRRIGNFGLFLVLLLLVGAMFNGLWSCLIWDRLYDSTDYYLDFCPFFPITRSVIDAPWGNERGRLLGVSLFQLQLVWLLFAAGTWSVTIFLYRCFSRRPPLVNSSNESQKGGELRLDRRATES
jgi:hypothetical protein